VTKRLEGKAGQYPRDPHNWYREPRSAVEQLADVVGADGDHLFAGDLIFDPCCGKGNVLDVFKSRGHATVGSDIVDRHPRHRFFRSNVLHLDTWPRMADRAMSIVTNPPYGKQDGYQSIGGDIIHRVLNLATFRRAAFLLPIEFLCGQERYRMFQKWKPSHVAYCSERPSMPPGAMVEDMGDAAYANGMADYVWIIWTAPHRWRTESIWLRPSGQ
jgi:hypothetical protein